VDEPVAHEPEVLFEGRPESLRLFIALRRLVETLCPSEMVVRKTQVSFLAERGFAWVWLPQMWVKRPETSVTLAFVLPHRVDHPRIEEVVEPYPERWMHHIIIERESDLDGDVRGWLGEAYAFGRAKKTRIG
jgi:hypothetical protein